MVVWQSIYNYFGGVHLRIDHVQNFGLLLGYFWLLGARQESRGKLGWGKSPRRPWTYFLWLEWPSSMRSGSLCGPSIRAWTIQGCSTAGPRNGELDPLPQKLNRPFLWFCSRRQNSGQICADRPCSTLCGPAVRTAPAALRTRCTDRPCSTLCGPAVRTAPAVPCADPLYGPPLRRCGPRPAYLPDTPGS